MREYLPFYQQLVLENLDFLIHRFFEQEDPKFLNTKVNLFKGEEFTHRHNQKMSIYDHDLVYGWVQGRGLEALAGHAKWIEGLDIEQKENYLSAIRKMLEIIGERTEQIRSENGGHLYFMFKEDKGHLKIDDEGEIQPFSEAITYSTATDMFYSKGLLAAGHYLQREDWVKSAGEYMLKVLEDIESENFQTDQQMMDPKNKVKHIEGRFSHGPRMIMLGGIAIALEIDLNQKWIDKADQFMRYIFEKHIWKKQEQGLEVWDFVEFLDGNDQPWRDEAGVILCDPGHALEFIGLALKIWRALEQQDPNHETLSTWKENFGPVMLQLLPHVFQQGYTEKAQGIVKAYDLASRAPCNEDMPWWNLPETMRATVELSYFFPEHKTEMNAIFEKCHRAFLTYLNPEIYRLAVQTKNNKGETVDVIPAVPDADPCYHTGLSLIDALRILSIS